MNKIKYFIFIPTLFALFSCKNNNLPKPKFDDICNITFTGTNVTPIEMPTEVKKNREISFSLDIPYISDPNATWSEKPSKESDGKLTPPNKEYYVYTDDIHVYIGGEEFKDSFTFYYMNNANNLLTIKREYVVNDIEIKVEAKEPRNYEEYPLCLYGSVFLPSLDERIDYNGTDLNRDIEVSFAKPYQNVRSPIRTLNGQLAYPVYQHDDIDLTLKIKDGFTTTLPTNIWHRRNSRYTELGLEFTREYSPDGRTCYIHIPKFTIDDHCAFTNLEESK